MALSYRFGTVEVRPDERQLLVEGRPAPVGARAFDVLLALIDHRDRVMSKDELLERVWPGVVVEENNLNVQVSTLRKLLGHDSVATIPGRGYRFTLPLEAFDAAPSCLLPARNHNLPPQLSSFIGREGEVAALKEALGVSRLVTLTSVGGTGKTRLSLRVAEDVLGDYPHGVWFVELAPLADEQRVAQAVASALGVKEVAGHPVIEALTRHVRDRRLLIVLDNCEHLLRACSEVAKQLLLAGPNVRIIASSREALHVTGEAVYPVPALAKTEALRLFAARAAAVQPQFKVTERNAGAVAEICHRLDGIPLAIELAAARVRALPVERIALLLEDCLRVLTGGDRTALRRQQTLRASIDWSYDLLAVTERMLLRRLAVFTAGWTLEGAEAVGAGGDVARKDVMELLTRLVEQSLVEPDPLGERYRLLETVRQYAHECLRTAGEEDATRGRHLDFCLALAEKAQPELVGPSQGPWLARLDAERENLLAAHAWCDRAADGADRGLRLARATKMYWMSRGLLTLGHRLTVEALGRSTVRDAARCRALFDAGQLGFLMGRYDEAQRYLEESLTIARKLGDTKRVAAALQPLGMACLGRRDLATARRHLEEALALARSLGNERDFAAALTALAQLHRVEGDLDRAQSLYDEGLALARKLDDPESIAVGLLNLAMVAIGRRAGGEAARMLREVLGIASEIGSKRVGESLLEVCAGLAAHLERWDDAARFFGAAEAQAALTGLRRDPADEAFLAPLVERARNALGTAEFNAAESAGRALSYDEALSRARAWLEPSPA